MHYLPAGEDLNKRCSCGEASKKLVVAWYYAGMAALIFDVG
jgi:hypothetical protein